MLSQKQAKLVYLLGLLDQGGETVDRDKAIGELESSQVLFGKTLKAFSQGGETIDTDNKTSINLVPVADAKLRGIIADTEDVWRGYSEQLSSILSLRPEEITTRKLASAIELASKSNVPLLTLSNDLTREIEAVSSKRQSTLRLAQALGVFSVLALLTWIGIRIIRGLRHSGRILSNNVAQLGLSNTKLETA